MNITLQTYRENTKEFSRKFDAMGVRDRDIFRAFSFFQDQNNLKVVEVGCGNGRDATEIGKYTTDYIGYDGTPELIEIAKQRNPKMRFQVAEFQDMIFPLGVDVVFAFASLLHANKDEALNIFLKIHEVMNQGGIIFLSLQYGKYGEYEKSDENGRRLYYYYSPDFLREMIGNIYESTYLDFQEFRGQKWFTLALKKI